MTTADELQRPERPKRGIEPSHTAKIALGADADSRRWFPDRATDTVFMTLCLAGEVGELANEIKKVARGTADIKDARTKMAVTMELADVYTYLLALSAMLGVDLEKAYYAKRAENVRRYEPKGNNNGV